MLNMTVVTFPVLILSGLQLYLMKSVQISTDTSKASLPIVTDPDFEPSIMDNDIHKHGISGDNSKQHINGNSGRNLSTSGHPDDTNRHKSDNNGNYRGLSEHVTSGENGNIGRTKNVGDINRRIEGISKGHHNASRHNHGVNKHIHDVHRHNPDVTATYQGINIQTQNIKGRNPGKVHYYQQNRQNYSNGRNNDDEYRYSWSGNKTGINLGGNGQNHSIIGHKHRVDQNNADANWQYQNANITRDVIGHTSIAEEGKHGVRIRRQAESMNITWTPSCNITAEWWRDIQAGRQLFELNAKWPYLILPQWVTSEPNMTLFQWRNLSQSTNEWSKLTTISSEFIETWFNSTGLWANGSSDLMTLPWVNKTWVEAAMISQNDTVQCSDNHPVPTGEPVASSTANWTASSSTTNTTPPTTISTFVPTSGTWNLTAHMSSWPGGSYSLPMCGELCPDEGSFRRGNVSTGITTNDVEILMDRSGDDSLRYSITSDMVTIQTCVREEDGLSQNNWPQGKYCVLAGNSTSACPNHLERGKITVEMWTQNHSTVNFCCINSTSDNRPLNLPLSLTPFYLMPLYGEDCPEVNNTVLEDDSLTMIVTNNSSIGAKNASLLYPRYEYSRRSEKEVEFILYFCRYESSFDTDALGDEIVENGDLSTEMIVALVACLVTALVIVSVGCYLYKRRRKKRIRERHVVADGLCQPETSTDDAAPCVRKPLDIGSVLKLMLNQETQVSVYALLIHPDKLEMLNQIGKGAFGTVYYGRYKPDENPLHVKEVAIKTLRENCGYAEINGFVEESLLMSEFHHPNVMGLVGVSIKSETEVPLLVLSFMKHGDLQSYLRKFRYGEDKSDQIPDVLQLLSFCLHIARGMEYLAYMKFVHRDLAARNCMLDSNMVVKVADFGLARDIYSSSYYRQDRNKLLPIKWMAVESLQDRVFTSYSDVWSYGVTVWEIVTLGKVPYPDLENSQVIHFLEEGGRLKKPDSCPDHLYDLMLRCWLVNHKERPAFTDIVKELEDTLTGLCDYLDLDGSSKPKQESAEEPETYPMMQSLG